MAKKQLKPKELTTTQVNSLSYQGIIKFQIMRGDKIISTKTHSNNGLPDLFKYISHALAGTYHSALRPCKVALFNCNTTGKYEKPVAFNWNEADSNNSLTEVSPYVVYDAAPTVEVTPNGYSTTFRFKIPFNWLYRKSFNVVGLFSENNSPCAYYLCTSGSTPEDKQWDPENLNDITGNYSLIVEWTMEVANK